MKKPNKLTRAYNSELEGPVVCEEFTGWNHNQKAVWSWSEYDWTGVSRRKLMFRIRFLRSGKVVSSCNAISQA